MNHQLTRLGLGGYLFIGTAAVLIPSIMPSITEEFLAAGLTLTTIGLIFPARAAGGILGNLIAGGGSDLLGRSRFVWLASLLLALTLVLTGVAKVWLLFLAGFVLISLAQSALSTGINAMIADANRGAQAQALNTLHGVYGVGAAISPLLIGYLIDSWLPWRWVLGGIGVPWLVYAVVVYRLGTYPEKFRTTSQPEEMGQNFSGTLYRADRELKPKEQRQTLNLKMLGDLPFLSLFLISFIYNGVAYSLLGWIALFMEQSAGFSTFFSISTISIFYVALTLGRFICAAVTERIGYAVTLLILAVSITLTYPLVVVGVNPLVVIMGVFFTGLSLSGLFPTSLAYGARLYPHQTGTITGTLNVAMALGAMIPPVWTGMIAELWSFQTALGINYVMVPPLILIALYLKRVET